MEDQTYQLPPASSLYGLPAQEQSEALTHLFEPCPTLIDLIVPLKTSVNGYQELADSVNQTLRGLADSTDSNHQKKLEIILSAHPRLGAKKVDSVHSKAEQATLQGSQEEADKLKYLNDLYEKTFPGLRYVVFVNGRSRSEIMQDMKARIHRGDPYKERIAAIQAMCDIAIDRASKLTSKL